jgi:tRNA nucleotidyltransferase/poly(A) polymerase
MKQRLEAITVDRIDPDAAKVVRRLTRYGHQAYLVGGCVRDLLLGREPKDFDVATSATPDDMRNLFRNCRIIGRRFRLAHLYFGPKVIETATFRAAPRDNPASSDPLIWHDNVFGTAEEDARRRDFTINGLFYEVGTGKVIDWVGGIRDLRSGIVSTIGDPDVRMQEDPVRILRAIKFSARLGFSIDEQTRAAMVRHAPLIARCSVARVLEEIYKLLRGGTCELAFRQMAEIGVLPVLFPELAALMDTEGPQAPICALRAGRRRQPLFGAAEDDEDDEAPGEEDDDEQTARLAGQDALTSGELLAITTSDDALAGFDTEEVSTPPIPLSTGPTCLVEIVARSRPGEFDPDSLDERLLAEQLLGRIGLKGAGQKQQACDQLWRRLHALDRLVKELDKPPYPPVLLGAVLLPLAEHSLRDDRRMGVTVQQVELLVRAVSTRLQISRRHRERLKQILVAQRRLVKGRPRRTMMMREYFHQALQLLSLRDEDEGRQRALEHWESMAENKRRRRRRRRSGLPNEMTASDGLAGLPRSETPSSSIPRSDSDD